MAGVLAYQKSCVQCVKELYGNLNVQAMRNATGTDHVEDPA